MTQYRWAGRGFPLPVPARPVLPRPRIGMRPVRAASAPMRLYSTVSPQVPISGAQGTATISAAGTATISVGPAGAGTIWYPASAVISTSVGLLDVATCNIYLGPLNTPVTLVGPIFSGGGGVLALPVPSMTPGVFIIAVWSGGTAGSSASLNVTGTQTVLMRDMPGG